ncbi:rhoptry-associated protein 2 [Hepatocystis sp. ex Piliocolobus tephrosceles]|nr:rhoptry-associated protein 2 [Hepatocystis sp. ex Piliocolobus tephrosceles]
MNIRFVILFFVSICLQNVVKTNVCDTPLYDFNLNDFSLNNVLVVHSDAFYELGKWINFFFSHFSVAQDALKYMQKININVLEANEHSCFIRALNIFLIHYYARIIRNASLLQNAKTYFHNVFRDKEEYLFKDFYDVLEKPKLTKLLDNIILTSSDISNLKPDVSFLNKIISPVTNKKNAVYTDDPKHLFIYNDINTFKTYYQDKYKVQLNIREAIAIRDYNLLGFFSVSDNYYSSDLTLPVSGTYNIVNNRNLLGFKKRSQTFTFLGSYYTDPVFGYCKKDDNEQYFGSLDDLLANFFSIVKAKMIYGHKRFLMEFDNSLILKTYKMNNLKGFRFLKSLFRSKNLQYFIDMYINLVSTEISFLRRDFDQLFDITVNCHVREFANIAGTNYYAMKDPLVNA